MGKPFFRPSLLSKGERTTLEGLAAGLMCKEIAARNGWSDNIPHTYAHRAKRKLRCRTRMQLVAKFVTMKLKGQL